MWLFYSPRGKKVKNPVIPNGFGASISVPAWVHGWSAARTCPRQSDKLQVPASKVKQSCASCGMHSASNVHRMCIESGLKMAHRHCVCACAGFACEVLLGDSCPGIAPIQPTGFMRRGIIEKGVLREVFLKSQDAREGEALLAPWGKKSAMMLLSSPTTWLTSTSVSPSRHWKCQCIS
eukprot:scaffold35096_cov18-Tisochrysis_lutea.AAC.1